MQLSESIPSSALASDAELVAACLAGDRSAFGPIVERHQRLLCSLAYSATGQLSQSEDLAQETFVEAWRQLPKLREPEKLRSWLCGILRNKVFRLRRVDGREPSRQADPLDTAEELESDIPSTPDATIEKEEQAIMWSALERVPETYREPLILYYREHRSVEHVAVALDLSEDAVKQRLSRGRKILQEQVLSFVEGALARSTPGKLFTIGVLAALPPMATPAKAAGIGAAAAQGSLLMKWTGVAALLASLSGVISAVLALRANLDQARTPAERRFVVKATIGLFGSAIALLAILYGVRAGSYHWWEHRLLGAISAQVLVLSFVVAWPMAMVVIIRRQSKLRSSERIRHPDNFADARDQVGAAAKEYRSRWQLWGVPLVHIRFSTADEREKPVFGWVAGGDRAYGLLFAWGGIAVAPISVGAVAGGILAVGSVSVGVISLGMVSVGLFALGSAAVGVKALAWLSALGWDMAASGGFAIAQKVAVGPVAFASHANDEIAMAALNAPDGPQDPVLWLALIAILVLVPVILYARAVRQRLGRRAT
ncbi:RNA polymerase sigma factor [Synoicihabitans lomoniglobus]|uniref:RNA polymerase sigma factor n=1 Tax=Synoicihabitans lomoniglobus TaxID=2909285 RepID=A0AAE9ZU78_9BACT|nr:RNA polymerase sigma factor [Opitutaceae bacterium LMO-M01]WED63371.1 RNA polymerase sigma factor [Opitutaceae bacterium LMO-M01]